MKGFQLTVLGLTTGAALTLAAAGAWAGGPSFREDRDAALPNWTGFYIGGAVGYNFGFNQLTNNNVPGAIDFGLQGAQGVVSLGYDFHLGPRWLLGAFADYAFGDIEGAADIESITIDNQWAIGGRLGYLWSPATLWYGTAGYTQADFETPVGEPVSETLQGIFVGAGIEHALSQSRNLSLKLDYRFSMYEQVTGQVFNNDNEVHSIRVGVNWRFGRN